MLLIGEMTRTVQQEGQSSGKVFNFDYFVHSINLSHCAQVYIQTYIHAYTQICICTCIHIPYFLKPCHFHVYHHSVIISLTLLSHIQTHTSITYMSTCLHACECMHTHTHVICSILCNNSSSVQFSPVQFNSIQFVFPNKIRKAVSSRLALCYSS